MLLNDITDWLIVMIVSGAIHTKAVHETLEIDTFNGVKIESYEAEALSYIWIILNPNQSY